MSGIMATASTQVKGGSQRESCARCGGQGWRMGSVPETCDVCEGFGYYTDSGDDDSPPPVATYEAVTVGGTLETALSLDGLAKAMRNWRLVDDDVAVFRVAEGRGCRIVGAFVPDGKGGMSLRMVDGVAEAK